VHPTTGRGAGRPENLGSSTLPLGSTTGKHARRCPPRPPCFKPAAMPHPVLATAPGQGAALSSAPSPPVPRQNLIRVHSHYPAESTLACAGGSFHREVLGHCGDIADLIAEEISRQVL